MRFIFPSSAILILSGHTVFHLFYSLFMKYIFPVSSLKLNDERVQWYELLGNFGSGKSTFINRAQKFFLNSRINVVTSEVFFSKPLLFKIYIAFTLVFKHPLIIFRIIYILCPYYLKAIFNDDSLSLQYLGIFFKHLVARFYAKQISIEAPSVVLWEGEHHLIPMVSISVGNYRNLFAQLLKLGSSNQIHIQYLYFNCSDLESTNRILG